MTNKDELENSFNEQALLKIVERIQFEDGDVVVISAKDDETLEQFASILNDFLNVKILLIKEGNVQFIEEIDEERMATMGWYRKDTIEDAEFTEVSESSVHSKDWPPKLVENLEDVEYTGLSNPNVIDILRTKMNPLKNRPITNNQFVNLPQWLQIVFDLDTENIDAEVESYELIADNGISRVHRYQGRIYKRSTPFLTVNEHYFLDRMRFSGYVPPNVDWYDKYTIAMDDLGVSEPIIDTALFTEHKLQLILKLAAYDIAHGDLTPPNIIVKNNHPYVLDWAEARLASEGRQSKRPELTDREQLAKTWKELIDANS